VLTSDTPSGIDRYETENWYKYTIPTQGEPAGDGITIEAYTVQNTNKNCPVNSYTIVEYYNPQAYWNETTYEWEGGYSEINDGAEHVTLDLTTDMTINFNPTQEYFLTDLVPRFAAVTDGSTEQ
jgi:hypothetical protein